MKDIEKCMEKDKVKACYDESTDIFYMLFKQGPGHEVARSKPATFILNSTRKAE